MDLDNNLHILKLFDMYGVLLTDKQRECMNDYLVNNLTLSEISQNNGISRQAVNFNIKESTKLLIFYEEKLGLCRKCDTIRVKLSSLNINDEAIGEILSVIKE